ncbi:hypothetical protein M378DRAFT_162872, partial [Amanita muscaria Koide BX008]
MGLTAAVVSGICLLCILLLFVFVSGCGRYEKEKGLKKRIAAPPDPILPRRYSPTLVEGRPPPPAYTREPVIYPTASGVQHS